MKATIEEKQGLPEEKGERADKPRKLLDFGIHAHGVFAVGVSAHGVVAFGVLSHGVVSVGVITMGVFSAGLVSMGLLSTGLVTMGLQAFGPQRMQLGEPHQHHTDRSISDATPVATARDRKGL